MLQAEHDARLRCAAEMVDVTALLDRLPAELSGGDRHRVALARTIVGELTVFLMDAPLSHLDAKLRAAACVNQELAVPAEHLHHLRHP